MPTTVKAFGATSATDPLVPMTIERRDLGPRDVRIAIRYAGDLPLGHPHDPRRRRPIDYPQVVGHEIVGEVEAIGAEVTKHALGDRVGVGCMVNSCRTCENCLAGLEQYCLNGNVGTYASKDVDGTITQGGYSTHVVVDEDFVLRVPESIPYEAAAPLLLRRHHDLLAARALGHRRRLEGRRRRNGRPRPHGREARRRARRRRHRPLAHALEAGGRTRLRREGVLRDERPCDVQGAPRDVRPSSSRRCRRRST